MTPPRMNALAVLAVLALPACAPEDATAPKLDAVAERVSTDLIEARQAQDGPYEVGFTMFMVHDETRGDRPIAVYVWYPADPAGIDGSSPEAMYPLFPFVGGAPVAPSSAFEAYGLEGAYQEAEPAAGPFPLVMYSPGWQGTAYADGHFIGTGLARNGFVVAGLTHWGDQATVNPAEPFHHLNTALFNRPRDVSLALDAMLERNGDAGDLLFASMDAGAIIASGWSLGGYAAMVLAGGDDVVCDLGMPNPPPETCAPSHPDPRISAIIPLDGSNQALHFAELARIDVPVLGMGREWNEVGAWQARQHAAFSGQPSYRVDVFNTAHTSFSSLCLGWEVMDDYGAMPPGFVDMLKSVFCPIDVLDGAEVHRIILKYMLAFLNHDPRVLTPGHALTSEPNVEFFRTEKRNANAIEEDWPDLFTYFMHQPGAAHAAAYQELLATAPKDDTGAMPYDFALRRDGGN